MLEIKDERYQQLIDSFLLEIEEKFPDHRIMLEQLERRQYDLLLKLYKKIGYNSQEEMLKAYGYDIITLDCINDLAPESDQSAATKEQYSLKELGEFVFYGCTSLNKIILPEGISGIEPFAFTDCKNLTEVFIPNGVKWIGSCAFSGCKKLKEIIIPESVEVIGALAFKECKSLEAIIIPSSVTHINDKAFSGCEKLKRVDVLNDSTIIANDAFEGCKQLELTSLKDKETLDRVNWWMTCKQEKNVVVPSFVDNIHSNAFENSKTLESIVISENVENIGWGAFQGCENLKSVVIEDGVKTIESNAFGNCVNLEHIELPDSITEIGENAFEGCSSIREIVFPNNIKRIKSAVCSDCNHLESVSLPESLELIDGSAFYGCKSLKELVMPKKIQRVDWMAFAECDNLLEVFVSGSEIKVPVDSFFDDRVVDFNIEFDQKLQLEKLIEILIKKDRGLSLIVAYLRNEDFSDNKLLEDTKLRIEELENMGVGGVNTADMDIYFDFTEEMEDAESIEIDGCNISGEVGFFNEWDSEELLPNIFKTIAETYTDMSFKGTFTISCGYITVRFIFEYNNPYLTYTTYYLYTDRESENKINSNSVVKTKIDIRNNDKETIKESVSDDIYEEILEDDEDNISIFKFDSVDSITLKDSVFVLTGFSAIEENKIGDIIVSGGGEIKSSTVLATNYLIVKEDYDHQTKKYDRAIELKEKGKNISIISDKLFYELVEENSVNKENSREDILDSPAIKECIFGIAKELSKINETLSLLINEIEKKKN